MDTSPWKPVGRVDFAQLREARMQAHYAAQWLARAARAYIRPLPDDRHTNLGWDDSFGGFTTHPFTGDKQLGLRIPNLTLSLLENGRITQSCLLDKRNDADVRNWLGRQMQALELSPEPLDAALPYTLTPHPLAQGARYDATTFKEPLSELAAWYGNGFSALSAVMHWLVARGLPASDVRCWPHHFDLDCVTPIDNGSKNARTIGAGFSPGDQYYEEPYFYVNLYPRPDTLALPSLHKLGHWHTQDFLAAVAPAGRIVTARNRQAETEAFLYSATDEIVKLSSRYASEGAN